MRPKDGSGEHRMHSHAIQWQWREWNYVDLTGYGYFINNDTAANFSSRTVGARLGYQQKSPLGIIACHFQVPDKIAPYLITTMICLIGIYKPVSGAAGRNGR